MSGIDEKELIRTIFSEVKAWLEPEFEKIADQVDSIKSKLSDRVEKLERTESFNDSVNARRAADLDRIEEKIRGLSENVRPAVEAAFEAEMARWALDFERRASDILQREVDRFPKPKDGKDGKDGLSAEDFDVELNERTLAFTLRSGGRVIRKERTIPLWIDRGVHKYGAIYKAGDVVSYTGGAWLCKRSTNTSPPSESWRLIVKRGRDGKDGKDAA